MDSQEYLIDQISELQSAVSEMKCAFSAALEHLSALPQPDITDQTSPSTSPPQQAKGPAIEPHRGPADGAEQEEHSEPTDLLMVVRELREQLGAVSASIRALREDQDVTHRHLQQLVNDRELLLDELCRSGSLSEQIRQQLHQRLPSRTSSGCHSNDSGLGAPTEKTLAICGWYGPSDQDAASLPPDAPPMVSTLVQEYVNGLSRGGGYESDSSVSVAVAKSLTLSSTLSKRCGFEFDDLSTAEAQARLEEDSPAECGGSPTDSHSDPGRPDLDASDPADHETERVKVARELVDTERRYCSTLWTIQDTFAEPLAGADLLSADDMSTLFPEVAHLLYEKHCRLLHALEERLGAWHWQPQVGDIICKFVSGGETDVLTMYTSYVNGFPDLLKTFYRLCRTSDHFSHFLKTRRHHPGCHGLDLPALLLSPVQRVPRYVLLLQQLLRLTAPQHRDHAPLQLVLHQLRSFLQTLNGSMEHSFQLVAVHANTRELESRLSKAPRRRSKPDILWSEASTMASLRGQTKPESAVGCKARSGATVDRTASSSSSELPDLTTRSATVVKKSRRSYEQKAMYDCKSLPHIKQRRRTQIKPARSESALRDSPALSVSAHRHSTVDLTAATSSGVTQRLQFAEVHVDGSASRNEADSPLRSPSSPTDGTTADGGSQTLPRGRRLTVTKDGRCVTPEQRAPSEGPPTRSERRRGAAIRTFKNMFSLKKRVSRSGTLSFCEGGTDLGLPFKDQYTPIRELAASRDNDTLFRSTH